MPSGHTVMNKQHWDESKNNLLICGSTPWKMPLRWASNFISHGWMKPGEKDHEPLKRYMEVFINRESYAKLRDEIWIS